MKKLLALLVCFGLVSSMGLGIVGCDKGDKKKTEEKKTEETKKTQT